MNTNGSSHSSLIRPDFLRTVQNSLGICLGLPDPNNGMYVEKCRDHIRLKHSEKSLLKIRDMLVNSDAYDHASGIAEIVGLVSALASRFHWLLIPHHNDVFSWSSAANVRLIENSILEWQSQYLAHPTGIVIHWHIKQDIELLQDAAISVIATLLDELPQESYEALLAKN